MRSTEPNVARARVVAATVIALIAFAANSILCRLALGDASVGADPVSFTGVRLLSGAIVLGALARARSSAPELARSWLPAALLFLYAAAFSFAYVSLTTGTGALLLFGSVQLTMLARAIVAGERPEAREWGGLCVAFGGLVVLVFPGLAAPSVVGSALMIGAGAAWGAYSLVGRGVADAVGATARNFARAIPFAVALAAIATALGHAFRLDARGAALAVSSGALTSGLGYVVWYAALAGLTRTHAAAVQLAVPVLAALGGIVFLGEALAPRLVVASVLVLGGVALALPRKPAARHPSQ